MVTFKPKQSSSTEGEKTELDPSRVTQEDASERERLGPLGVQGGLSLRPEEPTGQGTNSSASEER